MFESKISKTKQGVNSAIENIFEIEIGIVEQLKELKHSHFLVLP